MKAVRTCALGLILLGPAACGAGSPSISGRYFGDVNIRPDDASKSIFASADLVIGGGGDVAGSKLTTKAPTSVVGEVASVTGSVVATGEASADAELTIVFPTLGTYSAKGGMSYGGPSQVLAGVLSARDATGALVGQTILSLQQE